LANLNCSTNLGTTPGSARVDTSPKDFSSPQAIFRKILLMIFPERVFGKSEYTITSGVANGPKEDLMVSFKILNKTKNRTTLA